MTTLFQAVSLPLFMFAMCALGILVSVRTEQGRNNTGRFRP